MLLFRIKIHLNVFSSTPVSQLTRVVVHNQMCNEVLMALRKKVIVFMCVKRWLATNYLDIFSLYSKGNIGELKRLFSAVGL